MGFTVRISDHMGKFNPLALSDVNHLILIAAGTGFTPMAKLTTTYLRLVQSGAVYHWLNPTQRAIPGPHVPHWRGVKVELPQSQSPPCHLILHSDLNITLEKSIMVDDRTVQ